MDAADTDDNETTLNQEAMGQIDAQGHGVEKKITKIVSFGRVDKGQEHDEESQTGFMDPSNR